MALAATGTEAVSAAPATTVSRPGVQPGHYRVEAKVVSVSAAAAREMGGGAMGFFSEEKVVRLSGRPGISILSCPSVDAAESVPAHIGVTRNVQLPHGSTREVGINLDVVPQRKGADSAYLVSIKDVRFQGFRDRAATLPIFHTGRVTTAIPRSAEMGTGYYCIDVPAPQKAVRTYDADGRRSAAIADANERELLFVKISRG